MRKLRKLVVMLTATADNSAGKLGSLESRCPDGARHHRRGGPQAVRPGRAAEPVRHKHTCGPGQRYF